jgi:hypothetical protein
MKIKMKRDEVMVKAMFYGTIASIMENQSEIKGYIDLAKKLFDELRSVPFEDLRSEFIGKLAEIIHEENKKTEE